MIFAITFYFSCIKNVNLGNKQHLYKAIKLLPIPTLIFCLKILGSCKYFLITTFGNENITVCTLTAGLLTLAIKSFGLFLYCDST